MPRQEQGYPQGKESFLEFGETVWRPLDRPGGPEPSADHFSPFLVLFLARLVSPTLLRTLSVLYIASTTRPTLSDVQTPASELPSARFNSSRTSLPSAPRQTL